MFLWPHRVIKGQWKQHNDFKQTKIDFTFEKVDEKGSKGKEKMATESQKRRSIKNVGQK